MAGNRGKPGPGRPKGSKNKVTQCMRELMRESLDEVGGKAWLRNLAETQPKAYAALVAKIIPTEVKTTVEGDLSLNVVTGIGNAPGDA